MNWSGATWHRCGENAVRKGEKLKDKVEHQLAAIKKLPELVRSMTPSVAILPTAE